MKKTSQRLFLMEIVLCIVILFISLSVTNLIFVRSMSQHQKNEAMIKMSEEMVLLSEKLQNENEPSLYTSKQNIFFDANGERVLQDEYYQLQIIPVQKESYWVYTIRILDENDEKLLSWDVIKVVK